MPLTTIYDGGTRIIGDANALEESLHPAVMAYVNVMSSPTGGNYAMSVNEIDAVNNMVKAMVANGIWSKMKAVYPIIGGTAAAHKYNLVDPRDADAAYRLSFLGGGWTHSSSGATPNGTTSYANTFVLPSTAFSANTNLHLSFYSRTNDLTNGYELGASYDSLSSRMQLIARFVTGGIANASLGSLISTAVPNSLGFYMLNSNSTNVQLIKNGIVLNTGTATTNIALYTGTNTIILCGERRSSTITAFSSKQCAFSSIGGGFSQQEAKALSIIVQAYQTKLGRQV
jgi:hypothetical protein